MQRAIRIECTKKYKFIFISIFRGKQHIVLEKCYLVSVNFYTSTINKEVKYCNRVFKANKLNIEIKLYSSAFEAIPKCLKNRTIEFKIARLLYSNVCVVMRCASISSNDQKDSSQNKQAISSLSLPQNHRWNHDLRICTRMDCLQRPARHKKTMLHMPY